jgi:YD repeat-containing protein
MRLCPYALQVSSYALRPPLMRAVIVMLTDPRRHTVTAVYNADGGKTSVTDANGHATSYSYDNAGNRTQLSVTGGSNPGTTGYSYDTAD